MAVFFPLRFGRYPAAWAPCLDIYRAWWWRQRGFTIIVSSLLTSVNDGPASLSTRTRCIPFAYFSYLFGPLTHWRCQCNITHLVLYCFTRIKSWRHVISKSQMLQYLLERRWWPLWTKTIPAPHIAYFVLRFYFGFLNRARGLCKPKTRNKIVDSCHRKSLTLCTCKMNCNWIRGNDTHMHTHTHFFATWKCRDGCCSFFKSPLISPLFLGPPCWLLIFRNVHFKLLV